MPSRESGWSAKDRKRGQKTATVLEALVYIPRPPVMGGTFYIGKGAPMTIRVMSSLEEDLRVAPAPLERAQELLVGRERIRR